jgi:cytosine/adenosine deaminase-related metal-dependent hydrolase
MANRTHLKASWCLPINGESRPDAIVTINGSEIEGISSFEHFQVLPGENVLDLGQAIILPGLINLHSHLEYSAIRLLDPQKGLVDWIGALVGQAFKWTKDEWFDSAMLGAKLAALSGTTCLADGSPMGTTGRALARVGLRGIVGLELYGIDPVEAETLFSKWLVKMAEVEAENDPILRNAIQDKRVQFTISPHAPYTVSPELWAKAHAWAKDKSLPLLTHLCESKMEVAWLAHGNDEIDRLLTFMPKLDGYQERLYFKGQGLSPVQHLEKYELLDEFVVAAHMINVQDRDLQTLVKHGVKAVNCPRSNALLGHGSAPIAKFFEHGIEFGFGTDSLASTENLDILSEARVAFYLAKALDSNTKLNPKEIIHKLTLGAASVLGLDKQIGSIEPGKKADLAVFTVEPGFEAAYQRPEELLLMGGGKLSHLFVDGKHLVRNGVLSQIDEVCSSSR